jgi:hypothetical protein
VLGSDYSASIEAVKKLLDGSIPVLPRFGFNVVDVDKAKKVPSIPVPDFVAGIAAAVRSDCPGTAA